MKGNASAGWGDGSVPMLHGVPRAARNRCSNRYCCALRNYASDVRPTDALAVGVESPGQTLAAGVVFCTAGLN